MKPFEQIEKTKKVVNELKYNHQFIKDKVRIAKSAERINTLIDTVNMFDGMLVSKYKTNALDSLLLHIVSDYLQRYYVEVNGNFKNGLPIRDIIQKIDLSLQNNSIDYLAESIRIYLIESNAQNNKMEKIATKEEIQKLIKESLTEIKQSILWRK